MARWVVLIVALWTLVIEPTFGVYEWMAEPAPGQQSPCDKEDEPLGGRDAWLDQALPQHNDHEANAKAMQPTPVPVFDPIDWDTRLRPQLNTSAVWYTAPAVWSVPYPPSDLPLRI